MTWKEQFDNEFCEDLIFYPPESNGTGEVIKELSDGFTAQDIKDFITTEIIEKLIEDIPDKETYYFGDCKHEVPNDFIKQQLRERWLK